MAKAKQETFAQRLAALREKAGISQYRLAQLSGVSKQALSQLECGTSQPSWETVRALARGLGIGVAAFDTGQAEPVAGVPARPRGRPRPTASPLEGAPPIPELPARHDVPGTAPAASNTPEKPRDRRRKRK